jgi:hypothetical protein
MVVRLRFSHFGEMIRVVTKFPWRCARPWLRAALLFGIQGIARNHGVQRYEPMPPTTLAGRRQQSKFACAPRLCALAPRSANRRLRGRRLAAAPRAPWKLRQNALASARQSVP